MKRTAALFWSSRPYAQYKLCGMYIMYAVNKMVRLDE